MHISDTLNYYNTYIQIVLFYKYYKRYIHISCFVHQYLFTSFTKSCFFSFVYLLLSTYKKLLSVKNSGVILPGAKFTLEEAFVIMDGPFKNCFFFKQLQISLKVFYLVVDLD